MKIFKRKFIPILSGIGLAIAFGFTTLNESKANTQYNYKILDHTEYHDAWNGAKIRIDHCYHGPGLC